MGSRAPVAGAYDWAISTWPRTERQVHRRFVTFAKWEKSYVTIHRSLRESARFVATPQWEMTLFDNQELVSYLNSVAVKKSVYEYVEYDSEVEREFARQLDAREDVKLFVKLPRKFLVDTPVGQYNPDWAILKEDGQALYLVRETKSTHNLLELRNSEADKIRCGQRHFEALGVSFAVAVNAVEV